MALENEEVFLDLSGQPLVEPTEPPTPVEPTPPIEPTEPPTPVEPTEPIEPTEPPTPVEPTEPVILDDKTILEKLSEKLGRSISSFDELTPKEEKQLAPQLQSLQEFIDKTGRPIEDWVRLNKNFDQMTDEDKAKEILALKYPSFSEEDLQVELQSYLASDEDLDSEAARKRVELKKLIQEGSPLLEQFKTDLSQPVPGHNDLPPEIKEKVSLAEQMAQDYAQAVENQKLYNAGIEKSVNEMANVELVLGDDLKLSYNLSPEDKKELPSFLQEMPHWRNADGTTNHQAVVQDALKIRHFDKLISMVYQQGLAKGSESILKDANNITLGNPSLGADQPDGSDKGIVIEGLDKIIGKQGIRAKHVPQGK